MRLGIGSYTYTWGVGVAGYPTPSKPLSACDLIALAACHEIETLQLFDNMPLLSMSRTELGEIRNRARAAGIILHIGTRGVEPEHLQEFLEVAGVLDAKLVRTILPKTGRGSVMTEAQAMLGEIVPAYEAKSIALSVENHDRNVSRDLRKLVDAIGNPCFGVCLDTVNSLGIGEDHQRVLQELAPVANCFHAKDYQVSRLAHQMGFKVEGTPCGGGLLDFPDIVELFTKLRRNIDLVVELWTPYQGDMENTTALERSWAETSINYLKTLI